MGIISKHTKQTSDMIRSLEHSDNIEEYIRKNDDKLHNVSLVNYLSLLLEAKNVSKSHIIHKADIDRVYGYEIFRGKKRPGRNTLLRILLSFEIDISDMQTILKKTGYPALYPKNMRDAILVYGINKKMDVIELNTMLWDMGYDTI